MTASPPPPIRGLTEITTPFLSACSTLTPGQLVKTPSLGMLDAMNALTVMDPRMDAGVARRSDEREEGDVPWLDEQGEGMTSEEVCACIDQLVENEMLFNKGWPLVPTVFTSRHFRLLPTLRLSQPRTQQRPLPFSRTATSDLFHNLLLPYLEAYNLSLAYVWSELVTKLAMYEGEEWIGDTAGLWAEGEEFGVAAGAPEVDHVLSDLSRVEELVRRLEIDDEMKEQLLIRLQMRYTLLYNLVTCISGMPDTNLSPPSTTTFHSLSRLRGSSNPLPRVAQSFDTHSARLFRQSMPPVPAFEPQPAENVAQRMARMVHGLALVVELRETGWREREDAMWVFSTLGMGVEGEEMAAVVRSCLSWSVMTPAQDDSSPTTQGFDDQPSILAQWMQSHALVDEFDLERVMYSVASADGDGGGFESIEAVRRFFYHLHDNIRLDMHDRSQNRARQYRQLPLSARRWLAIGNDIPPPLTRFFPALQPALGALYGDTLLDALLGTFDLDLITPGAEGKVEYGWMYWFISRVAGDRLRMGQAVDERSAGNEASWRTVWARAWAEIGNALFLAFTLLDTEQEKSATDVPFSSSLRPKSQRRAVFEYRFRPFVSTMVDDVGEPLSPTYEEYVAACQQVKEIPSHSLRREIEHSFTLAQSDFQAIHRHESSRRTAGPQQQNLVDLHKAACKVLAGRIDAYTRTDGVEEPLLSDAGPRVRKWLPPVDDIRSLLQ